MDCTTNFSTRYVAFNLTSNNLYGCYYKYLRQHVGILSISDCKHWLLKVDNPKKKWLIMIIGKYLWNWYKWKNDSYKQMNFIHCIV